VLLVVRVNPTAQDVHDAGVPGLQVAQLLLHSWHVELADSKVLPG